MKKIVPLLISLNLLGLSGLAHADNLLQVYQQVQTNNPQLKQAEAERNAAYASIGISRGSLLPQLSLTGSYGTQRGQRLNRDQNSTRGDASLVLSMSLFNYQNWANFSIAKKQAAIADIKLKSTEQQVMLDTATSYFNVLKAMDELSLVLAKRDAIYKQYEQTEERYKVGLLPITDMQNAKAQYDQTLSDEVTARNGLNNALEKLRQISGKYYDQLATLNTNKFNYKQPENINTLLDTAHQSNLSIVTAKLSKSISLDQIHSAKSGYLPTVTLNASASLTRNHNFGDKMPMPSLGTTITGQNQLGVTVSLPLFSGGQTYAATKAAGYNYVSSNESLEQTVRLVNNDIYSYYNNILAAISSAKANEQAVVSAQSSLDATIAGYKVGTRTIVDVLNATTTLYTAKKQLSDARYNYLTSLLQMKFATGTLTEQDLLNLNNELGKTVNMQQATQYYTPSETNDNLSQTLNSHPVTKKTTGNTIKPTTTHTKTTTDNATNKGSTSAKKAKSKTTNAIPSTSNPNQASPTDHDTTVASDAN